MVLRSRDKYIFDNGTQLNNKLVSIPIRLIKKMIWKNSIFKSFS